MNSIFQPDGNPPHHHHESVSRTCSSKCLWNEKAVVRFGCVLQILQNCNAAFYYSTLQKQMQSKRWQVLYVGVGALHRASPLKSRVHDTEGNPGTNAKTDAGGNDLLVEDPLAGDVSGHVLENTDGGGHIILLDSASGNVKEGNDNNDVGDVNLVGVPIKLFDASGAVVATSLTDSSDNYASYDLPEGSYSVMETNHPGYLDVSDIDGGDDSMIAVTVGSGSSLISTGNDFVDEVGRTLSGFLLEDIDNDGDRGTPLAVATVSDSDGAFTFVGAPHGAYTVVEANIPGLVGVTDSHGEDPNVITVDLSTGESPDLTFVDELTSRAPTTPSSFPILSTDTLSTAVYTFVYIFVGFLLGILFVKCWTWRHHESETKKRLAGETEGTDKWEELVFSSRNLMQS
jgi:hypothetical protein